MKREEFWKQFEGTPRIDCVKLKYDIQAKIYEETKDMTWAERREYFRKGSEEFRREMACEEAPLVREDTSEYGKKKP